MALTSPDYARFNLDLGKFPGLLEGQVQVFKQKIAGAVFDGLKAFFELSRMEESV